MLTSTVLEFFKGDRKAVAKAADVTQSAVSQWGEKVPPFAAAKLALSTDGALRFDPAEYRHWNKGKKKRRRKAA